ncbi:HigA family addiction module antitoxin [Acinetobacter ursingii]|uniref:HigA family addiction module antitoxin n=1 Tax=Acinetobacter ursingii TaxID=108980 RepID=A0AA46P3H6_9GAMM|nr:HigA family addiction module antitoxin [Acinetobacter ursingii]MCU4413257.1 HigA family addiction module antidote protein [Acinetobacter sp. WU_MDCI_Axc73]MDH2018291.1 HigA family addiction module antitoxin [Acinetobacter ursingii]MDH2070412.1 HigA family addiction module antitoxin [Acinetobacter ursingii]UYF76639.1 HigA family addiction module antitoxin [Acinetobacter ursingii]
MKVMFNAPHPGEILQEYLEGISVTDAARALDVTRTNLSRILNGHTGISADMALRLSEALSTSPELWLNLQVQYDLWIASQTKRPTIQHLTPATA